MNMLVFNLYECQAKPVFGECFFHASLTGTGRHTSNGHVDFTVVFNLGTQACKFVQESVYFSESTKRHCMEWSVNLIFLQLGLLHSHFSHRRRFVYQTTCQRFEHATPACEYCISVISIPPGPAVNPHKISLNDVFIVISSNLNNICFKQASRIHLYK